jgi:hypothetical protein
MVLGAVHRSVLFLHLEQWVLKPSKCWLWNLDPIILNLLIIELISSKWWEWFDHARTCSYIYVQETNWQYKNMEERILIAVSCFHPVNPMSVVYKEGFLIVTNNNVFCLRPCMAIYIYIYGLVRSSFSIYIEFYHPPVQWLTTVLYNTVWLYVTKLSLEVDIITLSMHEELDWPL